MTYNYSYSDLFGITLKKKKDPKTADEVIMDARIEADRQRLKAGLPQTTAQTNYVPVVILGVVVLFVAFIIKKKFA